MPSSLCALPYITRTGSLQVNIPTGLCQQYSAMISLNRGISWHLDERNWDYWASRISATSWFYERKQKNWEPTTAFSDLCLTAQHLQRLCYHLNPYIKSLPVCMPRIVSIFLTKPSLSQPYSLLSTPVPTPPFHSIHLLQIFTSSTSFISWIISWQGS